ncbi:MAG: hypothetical protein QM621_05145 [Aeromicrobium sp.]|uniref:lipase family alpha/beta hydrolase n=1 Tax=Aeromicrobium sp. TaxID=1871063 RepID=UPI0039E5180D
MRKRHRGLTAFAVMMLSIGLWSAPAVAADPEYAPLDRPGPELTVPEADLAASLKCTGDFTSDLKPVLFVPPTGATPDQTFEWNYGKVFRDEGRSYCTVTLPLQALGDIQTSAEYITYGIRETYETAGRKIAVLGHSQGGMSPRWSLRFWPDTRTMVDEQIGMGAPHNGTALIDPLCSEVYTCSEAVWQQRSTSNFVAALNAGPQTFEGIDYTSVYSLTDEVVAPPEQMSSLTTGEGRISNVATQDVCDPLPTQYLYEHLAVGTVDPVAYAVVMDALDNDGPADPGRIDPLSTCLDVVMPGLTSDEALEALSVLAALPHVLSVPLPLNFAGAPAATEEPALRCYVFADGCPESEEPAEETPDDDADGATVQAATSSAGETSRGLGGGGGVAGAASDALPSTGAPLTLTLALAAAAALAVGVQCWSAGRLLGRRT